MRIILAIIFVVSAASAEEAYDPTNDLMAVFGAKCKGNGPLNATALNESQLITNVIKDISEDPKCQGLKTALSQVAGLNVANAFKKTDLGINMESAVGQITNLELAIQQETKRGAEADQDYLTELKKNLIEVRLKLVGLSSEQKGVAKRARTEMVINLDSYTSSLMVSLDQSDGCFINRPNVPAQVGAGILGVVATLNQGYSGGLILTASRMIDHLIRFIRKKSINKDLDKIVNTRLGQSLGCAFEGISQTYCEAADHDILLKTNQEAITQTKDGPAWKKGLRVNAQGQSSYSQFISKTSAGSPKASAGLVSDLQSAQHLRASLEYLGTTKSYLSNAKTEDVIKLAPGKAKELAFKGLLNDLSSLITPECSMQGMRECLQFGGPFKESFLDDVKCGPAIYIYSKGKDRKMKPGTNSQTSCSDYLSNYNPQPTVADLPAINIAVDDLFKEAEGVVTRALGQVQQSSNIQVLAASRLQVGGRSVLDYFIEANSYLETVLTDPNSIAKDLYVKKLISETQTRIKKAWALLEKNPPVSEEKAAEIVSQISQELIPKGDKAAIPSALNQIVQLDVEQKMRNGEVDSTLATLLQMPESGSINQMLQIFGNLDASGQQTRNARGLSLDSLTALASALNQPLKTRFETLKTAADKKDDDAENSLAILCLQTLAVPESPNIGDIELDKFCKGTSVSSIYKEASLKLNYDEISKGDRRTKMCSLHDFYRKSSLYGRKKSASPGGTN